MIIEASRTDDSGYRLFFESAADGMLITDGDGNVLDANSEACHILGRNREELLAAGREGLFDPPTRC